MQSNHLEIERRKQAAADAIRAAYNPNDEESPVTSFISHHLEELKAAYWLKQLNTPKPTPKEVLGILLLRSYWGTDAEGGHDEHGIDMFDFTLPDDVTDYVIGVHFTENGEIDEIVMES